MPDTIILVTPHGPVFQDAVAIMNDSKIQKDGRFSTPGISLILKLIRI